MKIYAKNIHSNLEECRERLSAQTPPSPVIKPGRALPGPSNLKIGDGKFFELAILYLDICNFSSWTNDNSPSQRKVLVKLNIFISEMIHIIKKLGGSFEKNTGDGIMAYFGTDLETGENKVLRALESAIQMHAINEIVLDDYFKTNGEAPIKFKIGIDFGKVTVSRIGPWGNNSIVAVGTTANIASKIMRLIPDGGICIGQDVFNRLNLMAQNHCQIIHEKSGFVYAQDNSPYRAFTFDYIEFLNKCLY